MGLWRGEGRVSARGIPRDALVDFHFSLSCIDNLQGTSVPSIQREDTAGVTSFSGLSVLTATTTLHTSARERLNHSSPSSSCSSASGSPSAFSLSTSSFSIDFAISTSRCRGLEKTVALLEGMSSAPRIVAGQKVITRISQGETTILADT